MQFWVFPSPYVSLAPWFNLLGYGVVPRKSPEWAAKAFTVSPLGCVVHCCSEPSNSVLWTRIDLCTASGVLDKRFMACCMQWSNMRKYRKVHVLKYRKVLTQFCANKNLKKPRKNAEKQKKILGSEKKRKSAETQKIFMSVECNTMTYWWLWVNLTATWEHVTYIGDGGIRAVSVFVEDSKKLGVLTGTLTKSILYEENNAYIMMKWRSKVQVHAYP